MEDKNNIPTIERTNSYKINSMKNPKWLHGLLQFWGYSCEIAAFCKQSLVKTSHCYNLHSVAATNQSVLPYATPVSERVLHLLSLK
jgi:hypothetical protein